MEASENEMEVIWEIGLNVSLFTHWVSVSKSPFHESKRVADFTHTVVTKPWYFWTLQTSLLVSIVSLQWFLSFHLSLSLCSLFSISIFLLVFMGKRSILEEREREREGAESDLSHRTHTGRDQSLDPPIILNGQLFNDLFSSFFFSAPFNFSSFFTVTLSVSLHFYLSLSSSAFFFSFSKKKAIIFLRHLNTSNGKSKKEGEGGLNGKRKRDWGEKKVVYFELVFSSLPLFLPLSPLPFSDGRWITTWNWTQRRVAIDCLYQVAWWFFSRRKREGRSYKKESDWDSSIWKKLVTISVHKWSVDSEAELRRFSFLFSILSLFSSSSLFSP